MPLCRNISKLFLIIINLSLLVASVVLISLGSWMFAKYVKYGHGDLNLDTALTPAVILLAVGFLGTLLAIIGCVATFKEQKCVLGIYFTLLLVILAGLIAGSFLSWVFSKSIDSELHKVMLQTMDRYNSDNDIRADVDIFQSGFQCCGVDNYTNWLSTPWYKNETTKYAYPESCCRNQTCLYTTDPRNDTQLFQEGCYEELSTSMRHHLVAIAGIAGAFALILLIGMASSCVLFIHRRRQPQEIRYIGIAESDAMRI